MTAVYAWVRRHRLLVDGMLAVGLGLLSVGFLGAQNPQHQPGIAAAIALLMVVPVVFRRRAPVTAFAVAAAGGAWQILGAHPIPSDIAILVLLYTVAAYRPRRLSIAALLTCIGGSLALVMTLPEGVELSTAGRLFFGIFLFGGCALAAWILGDSMRYRRGYYTELEDKAMRLEAERDAQAKIGAAAERARIARELHDVVAHHVSVMVVQADGARYVLKSDPDRAQAALDAVSATGRQALTEMRRLLGVLRSEGQQVGQHAGLAPVPGLGELRELLDQARAAGMDVSYTLTGPPRELPEGAELAAYRVVQESLTNTRKHAGLAARAAVTLAYERDGLIVQVTDDGIAAPGGDSVGLAGTAGTAESGGHGLAGMRERIAMYGGTVTAGPLPAGGFRVRAWLPCPAAVPASGSTVPGSTVPGSTVLIGKPA